MAVTIFLKITRAIFLTLVTEFATQKLKNSLEDLMKDLTVFYSDRFHFKSMRKTFGFYYLTF